MRFPFQISPLMRSRLQRFKAHRLGYLSFLLFMLIFVLTLGVELIANDKPIMLRYKQHIYVPILHTYAETTFGGVLESEAEYRDPAVQQLINHDGWMIWPLIRFADQTANMDLAVPVPSPPSRQNWLGTDDQGRDVLARLLYGLRVSILFGLGLTIAGALIGIMVGAIQGYYGGWIDLIGQRFLEVWTGLPQLFMIIILVSIFSASLTTFFCLMLLFGWHELVGLVRAEFLRARNFDYVRAAKTVGATDMTIMLRHILPNALSSSLSQIPFILTANITALTALDYLGYGLPPGSPSLGEIMAQGKNNLDAPWLALSGFFALVILLSLLVFIGEAARDAFDPKQS